MGSHFPKHANGMKVFVTGADGFLGTNIVRELLQRDYVVKALVQPGRGDALKDLKVETVEGDLLDEEDVVQAAHGCDYFIHAAANTSIWPARSEIVRKVNIDGTHNVIKAALSAKVKRMVSVGSANSFGNGSLEKPGNEESPFTAGQFGLDYIDSKLEAQKLILESVAKDSLDAIIVNPTFMLGPFDNKPSSGALLIAMYQGKVPGYTAGGRNFIYVKDVATAICNGLTMGRKGDCYIAANENMSYKEFNQLVAEELGIKAPKLYVPKPFMLLFGLISQGLYYITRKAPDISYQVARISLDTNYYVADKAIKELGMPQTPIRTAVREAFNWFKENGYLDKE